jgi:hypothetical protein
LLKLKTLKFAGHKWCSKTTLVGGLWSA